MMYSLLPTIVGAAISAAVGALTWCFRLQSSVVRLQLLAEIADKSVSTHGEKVSDHDARIAKVEAAHVAIASAQATQQMQNQQIIDKLAMIAELKVSVDNLARTQAEMHSQVVPRSEIEVIRENTAHRIDRLESQLKGKE